VTTATQLEQSTKNVPTVIAARAMLSNRAIVTSPFVASLCDTTEDQPSRVAFQ